MAAPESSADSDGSVVLYGIEDRPPLGEAVPLGIHNDSCSVLPVRPPAVGRSIR